MHRSIRRHLSAADFSRIYAEEYIPLNVVERASLFLYSSFAAFKDPRKGHLVACLGEMISKHSLANMYDQMRADRTGKKILLSKPLIDDKHIDFEGLKSLADGTLGKAYINFMEKYKFHANEREPVHFVENEELAYVMTRYRQLHDFSHVLFGLNTSVECEVALKAIEMIQTKLPMCALATIFGPFATPIIRIRNNENDNNKFYVKHESSLNDAIHYDYHNFSPPPSALESSKAKRNSSSLSSSSADRQHENAYRYVLYPQRILMQELLPWAIKSARNCKKAMHLLYVEEWLDRPLDEFREHYGISIPPEHLRCYTDIEPVVVE